MFFGFGSTSTTASGRTATAADVGTSSQGSSGNAADQRAKLLVSVFQGSVENMMVESTKHRGMSTVRDMAHATRSKHYQPNDLLHTFIVACEVCGHRKSCRPILLQCLADMGKLFTLNLMPVSSVVAQSVCDMARRLIIVLPERRRSNSATATAPTAVQSPQQLRLTCESASLPSPELVAADRAAAPHGHALHAGSPSPSHLAACGGEGGWSLVVDEELQLRVVQLLVALLSACPLGNPALPELLGLLLVCYAGAAPGSMLEEVCGTTVTQRTHLYCGQLLHSSVDGETAGTAVGAEGRGTPTTSTTTAAHQPQQQQPSATIPLTAQLHAVSFLKDLCALAAGRQTRWLKLTIAAVRPRGGGVPMSHPPPAAAPGATRSKAWPTPTTTTTSSTPAAAATTTTARQTLDSTTNLSASGIAMMAPSPMGSSLSLLGGGGLADTMEEGPAAVGTTVALSPYPHRLRVLALQAMTAFFADQRAVLPGARGAGVGPSGSGGHEANDDAGAQAGTVNVLFAQCLNEDVASLAVSTTHPALDMDMGVGELADDSLAGLQLLQPAPRSGYTSPTSLTCLSPPAIHNGKDAPHTSGLGSGVDPTHTTQQHQHQAAEAAKRAQAVEQQHQERRRAQAAGEAEQRFVLAQKLVLLVLSKYGAVMRNTTNRIVLAHALTLQQCRTLAPFARLFVKVPGTVASPLSVTALLLTLWRRAIADDVLLRLLLTTYTTTSEADPTVALDVGSVALSPTASPAQRERSAEASNTSTAADPATAAVAGQLPAFLAMVSECMTLISELTQRILSEDVGTNSDNSSGGGGTSRSPWGLPSAALPSLTGEEAAEAFPETAVSDAREYLADATAFAAMFAQSFARLTAHACAAPEVVSPVSAHDPTRLTRPAPAPHTTAVQERAVVAGMTVGEVRRAFLQLYPDLLRAFGLVVQGVLDEDSLHVTLKGITHWINIAARLGLPAERNGFLRALLAALRRHDPTADALLAYAVQCHPQAAPSDRRHRRHHHHHRHRSSSSGGGGGGGGAPTAVRGQTSSPPRAGTVGGRDTFGAWLVRNARRLAQDATAALPGYHPSTAGSVRASDPPRRLFSGDYLARVKRARGGSGGGGGGADKDSHQPASSSSNPNNNNNNNSTSSSSSNSAAVAVAGSAGGGGGGDPTGPLFSTHAEEQAHILLAVERLQQKLFVLRALFTVASSLGESLGADGWDILAEGFATAEPCIYRLQLFVRWIAEAAVEREQQQQLLSDAHHLRDALRGLFVECAQRFSDDAYRVFLSAMTTSMVERSAATQARLAARYTEVMGSGGVGRESDEDSSDESEEDSEEGGGQQQQRQHHHHHHHRPSLELTPGSGAYGFGCFWHWRLMAEGLGLAFASALPLSAERAALTWRTLGEVYEHVLHPHRLERWCTYLKVFPLRVSMLAYVDGVGVGSDLPGTIASPAGVLAGSSATAAVGGVGFTTSAPVAVAAAAVGATAATDTTGAHVPREMRELTGVLAGMVETVSFVAALTSLRVGRAMSLVSTLEHPPSHTGAAAAAAAAVAPAEVARLVESILHRIVAGNGGAGAGQAEVDKSGTAARQMGLPGGLVTVFPSTRLGRLAAELLTPPTLTSDGAMGGGAGLLHRLVREVREAHRGDEGGGAVTAAAVARHLAHVLTTSSALPAQLLENLHLRLLTAVATAAPDGGGDEEGVEPEVVSPSRGWGSPPPAHDADSLLPLSVHAAGTAHSTHTTPPAPRSPGWEAFQQLCDAMAFAALSEVLRVVQCGGEDVRGAAWVHLLRLLRHTIAPPAWAEERSGAVLTGWAGSHGDGGLSPRTRLLNAHRAAPGEGPEASEQGRGDAPALAQDRAASLAFRTLELIQHNCITSLDAGGLAEMIRCVGAFISHASRTSVGEGAQRLHTNLSAVQMLWSLADYLAQEPMLLAPVLDSSDVSMDAHPVTPQWARAARDDLWCALLLELQVNGCLDSRQEVRQSAQRTLYALAQSHGPQYTWQCWQVFLHDVLAEQVAVVLAAQRDRAAADAAAVISSPKEASGGGGSGVGDAHHGGTIRSSTEAHTELVNSFFLSHTSHGPRGGAGAACAWPTPALPAAAAALQATLAGSLSALEEVRVTVTDGASRVFVGHLAAMQRSAVSGDGGTGREEERLAQVVAALHAFVCFAGDAGVVLARGDGLAGRKEESALSAAHALHALLVELPDTRAETRELCWRALEHLLSFDPAAVLAAAAAASAGPAAAAKNVATTAATSGHSRGGRRALDGVTDHRTPAVVSAALAALCDDFCTQRSGGADLRVGKAASATESATANPARQPSPYTPAALDVEPYFSRLLRALCRASTGDAVVGSYFFPSKVQCTVVEVVAAVWPLLTRPTPDTPPDCSERAQVLHQLVWPRFPAAAAVEAVVRQSTTGAARPPARGEGLTLRAVLPPGAHPSALLQLLHLVCVLVLGLAPTGWGARESAGAVAAAAAATLRASRGSSGRESEQAFEFSQVAPRLVEVVGVLLMLQYASGEVQAGAATAAGDVPFGIPSGFFDECLAVLRAVLRGTIAPPPTPAPAAAAVAEQQQRRRWRREGVRAFSRALGQLVTLATETVRAYEEQARRTSTTTPPEAKEPQSKAGRDGAEGAAGYDPVVAVVLPDSLHGALITLDALIVESAATVQALIADDDDEDGPDSAAELIAALVATAATDTASLANVSRRSRSVLKTWSAPLPSTRPDGSGGAEATEVGGRHALHHMVRTAVHARCRTIVRQFTVDPTSPSAAAMLRDALDTLRESCPPPPTHWRASGGDVVPGVGGPAVGAAPAADTHAEDRESLRRLLPDLIAVVGCGLGGPPDAAPSPERVAVENELRHVLARTLKAVHHSLGLL